MRTLILGLLLLTACSSVPKLRDLNQIHNGMTKNQVLKELGEPTSTESEDGKEFLFYSMKDQDGELKQRVVVLEDGEVSFYGKASKYPKTQDKSTGQAQSIVVNPVNNINIGTSVPTSSQDYSRAPSTDDSASRLESLNKRFPGMNHACHSTPIYAANGDLVKYDLNCY
jgi:outer membrane protein assembly factor BamE (lipoprotein component of BamABCDE complex)